MAEQKTKRKTRSKYSKWIRTEADERAVRQGCYFNQEAADHVCNFFENVIVHSKGQWAGQPFRLLDWQVDLLSRLFGWMRPTGFRRFKQAGIWLPKKNGKSTLLAGINAYLLLADGEPAAELYGCAGSLKHAKIVFNELRLMCETSPVIQKLIHRKELEIVPSAFRIVHYPSHSYYEVLSSRPETADGWNIQAATLDELHLQKKPDLFDALRYGGSSRTQPLICTISTAGLYDPLSIGWQQWCIAKDIISGINTNTSFFAHVSGADPEVDDWKSEKTWFKSNPSLGQTISIESFREDFEEAQTSPVKAQNFKRRRLNIWVQAATTWITDEKWMACAGDDDLTEEELKQIKWTAGADLANTTDVAGLVLFGEHEGKYHVRPFFWINEEQASLRQSRDSVHYSTWANDGFMFRTPGNSIDYDRIRADINQLRETYNITKIAIDRWNATQLAQQLADDGFDVVFFGQGFKDMSHPTRLVEKLVADGSLVHGGHPVLRWMIGNVHIEMDAAANIKVSKKASREKVDGVVCLVQAIGIHPVALPQTDKPSIYETQGIEWF